MGFDKSYIWGAHNVIMRLWKYKLFYGFLIGACLTYDNHPTKKWLATGRNYNILSM